MENIINLFLKIEKDIKIYIYDFYPSSFKSIEEFVEHTMKNRDYDWGETYKSWLYIMNYIIKSPMYTKDPREADLYLVPQWENLYKGCDYLNDFIMPLHNAIISDTYNRSGPDRNHILIYISDDTPLFEQRTPIQLRKQLKDRFIRITYSGRLNNFGEYHTTRTNSSIFKFDYLDEIVVPPGVPLNYNITKDPSKYCTNNYYYLGDKNPPHEQIERKSFINYMSSNGQINNSVNSYFGLHCAGWGIWTARLYNYLNMGIIPIIPSDGVILPFEQFFDYESFTVKILSNTRCLKDYRPILYLNNACDYARKYSDINIENTVDQEEMIAKRLYKMQRNCKKISKWFNWRSTHKYKNPYTLIIIQLYDFVMKNNARKNGTTDKIISEKSFISKKEYYNLNENNVKIYRDITAKSCS